MSGASKILFWSVYEKESQNFLERILSGLKYLSPRKYNESMVEYQLSAIDHYQNEVPFNIQSLKNGIEGCFCFKRIFKNLKTGNEVLPYVHYLIISSDEEQIKKSLASDTGYFFHIVDVKNIQSNITTSSISDSETQSALAADDELLSLNLMELIKKIEEEESKKANLAFDNKEENQINFIHEEYSNKLNTCLGTIYGAMYDIRGRHSSWNFYLVFLNFPGDRNTVEEYDNPNILNNLVNNETCSRINQLKQFFEKVRIIPITEKQLEGDISAINSIYINILDEIEEKHWRSYRPKGLFENFLFSKVKKVKGGDNYG